MKPLLARFFLGCFLLTAAQAVPVTFQVDMSLQASLGNFDPAAHTVEVRGSFDGWGSGAVLSATQDNPLIFRGTVEVGGAAGSEVQYKFVMNQGGAIVWENNGVGPNGAQNRAFRLSDAAQTLPVEFFNNQAAPPGAVQVTFQVNMEIQKAIGNFDPAAHTVEVRGSFNNWSGDVTLEASSTNANVYKATVEITGSPGTSIEFKFVINRSDALSWEGNVGPAGGFGNRVFQLGTSPQVLPVVFFDNLSTNPGAGVPVTFRVNLGVQTALGAFDPASGTVTVAGPFNDWNTTATPLTNSPSDTNVYIGTVTIKSASGASIPFKFVLNGGTWENGDNRVFVLEAPAQTLPILYFNNQNGLGPLAIARSSPAEARVSWAAAPAIRLQTAPLATGPWQDVPDTAGLDSASFPISGLSRFFRLVAP